ncbi:aspartyl-tRNA synthetase-like protein [Calycina marina]|uniref:aspartate--tRNA ligase n=1 Tax=Calycina marina TaxID=1763456 RepID=A0A9P7Z537_9HELO|nr:aspartyl-tRNA synthetase-like protein [Calycina marina]
MSFLKKPFKKLEKIKDRHNHNSASDGPSTIKEDGASGTASPQSGIASSSPQSGIASANGQDSSIPTRQSQDMMRDEKKRRSIDKERVKVESMKRNQLARIESANFLRTGPEDLTKLYKPYSMNMSRTREYDHRILFKDIDFAKMDGQVITFRARIHTLRRMSAKMVFIVFRQQTITIQGLLQSFQKPQAEGATEAPGPDGTISDRMVKSVERYPSETIVVVSALVRKIPQGMKPVQNATIHNHELDIYEIHKVSTLSENVPFTVYDAENINRDNEDAEVEGEDSDSQDTPEETPRTSAEWQKHLKSVDNSRTSLDTRKPRSLPQRVRLNNRIVDLRTGPAQCIFRIQSGICNLFRGYLDERGFIEIHTPKLQGGATESGASVFEVNYFGRPGFLAQSPQLAKQMAIMSDFEKVYEVGPVFRAEDSNTPRHLTEYTGLDLEMALESHYHEALDLIDGMFKHLWAGIYQRFQKEIDLISHFYPHEKVEWLEETPRIPFKEGVQMLMDDGWKDDDGNAASPLEDLATAAERRLGQLVKEKYHTDYYILDKFPASARPFYTMPDPLDDRYTNSFDIFMRGQEILSGGQRIHDSRFLEKRIKAAGINPDSMPEYLEGFRWGAPPHAGCGIGLERLTFLFLNLGNIRLASMFPRDPKSLPAKAVINALRHPEASTTNPPWENSDYLASQDEEEGMVDRRLQFQPLEKLIANYGDAANTSWLDKRYQVWRHDATGAAQGYIVHSNFIISVGPPLCAKSQYNHVISAYLTYLKEHHSNLKPIWMIVNKEVEEYLGEKFQWRTLACIAEERADPRNNQAIKDKDLERKVRHADKEGIKNAEIVSPIPDDIKTKIDARVADWQHGRKGQQVHLTQIRPWVDEAHRKYYYASDSVGNIHAICVLHQLSPQNGYQIKFSLEFPNAPSGSIEALILYSMRQIAISDTETSQVTFGTGAMPTLEGGRNLGKQKVKMLKKAYDTINKQFKLTNKSGFREKMGVWNEPAFVAYPQGGLGAGGIRAIMGFLEEDG